MYFTNTVVACLFAATALAAPSLDKRFDAKCLDSCAPVTGQIGCITFNIWEKNATAVAHCVKGGKAELCACSECVPGLPQFAKDNSFC